MQEVCPLHLVCGWSLGLGSRCRLGQIVGCFRGLLGRLRSGDRWISGSCRCRDRL